MPLVPCRGRARRACRSERSWFERPDPLAIDRPTDHAHRSGRGWPGSAHRSLHAVWQAGVPGADREGHSYWLIAIRLTPLVFIDDIRDRNPAYRPETTHRIPDWQERIRVHVRRQPKSGFHLPLEIQVERRQGGTETEGARRQQHVLDRRVDR